MYWKFIDIKECCKLKSKIPVSRSGIYFGDIKINCLQSLVWWLIELTLRGKNMYLNHFNSDFLSDVIEES